MKETQSNDLQPSVLFATGGTPQNSMLNALTSGATNNYISNVPMNALLNSPGNWPAFTAAFFSHATNNFVSSFNAEPNTNNQSSRPGLSFSIPDVD